MSFPEYQHYRRSGAAWISNLPTNWRIAALKWVARRYAGGTPDKTKADYWTAGTIPWLNSGSVNQRLITEASEYITEDAYSHSSARWVPEGALVMALAGQGKTKGMVAQLAFSATCNQSMAAIVPLADINSRYLFWWLDAQYQNIRNLAGGDLRDGLNLELLGQIPCPIPTSDEQLSIASFLDRETTKIDALVADQERLIELLDEKRQAVIAHAVTKGLDRAVILVDSGVEWLGKVPAHWKIGRCGFYVSILSGFAFPSSGFKSNEEGVRLLRGVNVGVGKIRWDDTVSWCREESDGLDDFVLKVGDLVIGMDRPFIGEGMRVARVGPSDVPCLLLQRVASITTHAGLNSDYLMYLISSAIFVAYFSPITTGVSVPHISPKQISDFKIPIPSEREQAEIVSFLTDELEKLDQLTRLCHQSIEKLAERRSTLISAAVTGQIDVRQLEAT